MTDPTIRIVPMDRRHGPAVLDIYSAGIAEGNATFETDPRTWDAFDASHLRDHSVILALSADRRRRGRVAAPIRCRS
jgi:phosphinothricin acetyltransferase